MSIRLMTLVWDTAFPTQAQKLIALKLADYASDAGGSVFPARETLADKAGCSESTVKRALRCFRDIGLLTLVREGGGGAGDTNEWCINVTLLGQLADGSCRLVGGADELQLEGECSSPQAVENKGVNLTPLPQEGGHPDPIRGSRAINKGAASDPRLTKNHQEPSRAHAGACEAGASPACAQVQPKVERDRWGNIAVKAARGSFEILEGAPSWAAWLATLSPEDAAKAEAAGKMVCSGRWPGPEAVLLRIPKPTPDALKGGQP